MKTLSSVPRCRALWCMQGTLVSHGAPKCTIKFHSRPHTVQLLTVRADLHKSCLKDFLAIKLSTCGHKTCLCEDYHGKPVSVRTIMGNLSL